MPLQGVTFEQFGGLRLDQGLNEVGGESAGYLLNVDWNSDGEIRRRDGTEAYSTAEEGYDHIFPHSDTRMLMRRVGGALACLSYSSKLELESTVSVSTTNPLSFARFGTPSASYTFIADRTNTLRRFDGATFTSPTATVDGEASKAMPKGFYLASWPDGGNRLVVAGTAASGGPNGATSSSSHVWFSEPGNAEGYESTAYVQLSPGDGEEITAVTVWGGRVYVFKETKLFVFYEPRTDSEGKPVFDFYEITLGVRVQPPRNRFNPPATSAPSGVFFVTMDGVYWTTGSAPSLLSGDLAPLSQRHPIPGPMDELLSETRWAEARGVLYQDQKLYVFSEERASNLKTDHTVFVWVYNMQLARWTVWIVWAHTFAAWPTRSDRAHQTLYFAGVPTAGKFLKLYRFNYESEIEAAASTSEFRGDWQSGFYDLETPDEKTVTLSELWGSGNVDVAVAKDFGEVGSATTFELGKAPEVKMRQKNKSQNGRLFSHRLSGKTPWSVQRLVRYLESDSVPGSDRP